MEKEGKVKALFLMSLDTLIIVNSYILTFIIRFNFGFVIDKRKEFMLFLPFVITVYLIMLLKCIKVYGLV